MYLTDVDPLRIYVMQMATAPMDTKTIGEHVCLSFLMDAKTSRVSLMMVVRITRSVITKIRIATLYPVGVMRIVVELDLLL